MINRLQAGKFLSELRREHGMTQTEVAEKLDVSAKTVSRWETGQTLPDYEQMQLLCDLFSVRMEEILAAKRSEPSDSQPIASDPQNGVQRRHINRILYAGWIVAACGIMTSCVLFALLLTDRCKKTDAPSAAPAAEITAEPTVLPTAAPHVWNAKYTAADLPVELSERRLSDDELFALKNASSGVLRKSISTVADMLAWFNVTGQDIFDSLVNTEPGTNLFYYFLPEQQLDSKTFSADNLATPCAWLIQDDYPGICVLYINGANCFNIMCVCVPCSEGWFVFQPASFMPHGGFHEVLECVTVPSLSDLYSITDEFNASHHEQLMPIHRIDNLDQMIAFYEDSTTKHLSDEIEAEELPH